MSDLACSHVSRVPGRTESSISRQPAGFWPGLGALLLVAMATMSPSLASASEKFGGVEIGAKGVKASAVELDTRGPSPTLKVLELDKKTVDLTISRLKNKSFNQVLIGDVATVVADFSKALQEKLGVPEANIQVVASSGVPFVDNFADLVVAVRDQSGKNLNKIEAPEEAALTAMAIIPPELRTNAMVIDIGSGNTKGGAFLDDSGSLEKFTSIDVPFGTTSLSREIDSKMEAVSSARSVVATDVARQSIGIPLKSQMAREPSLAGRDPVLLSGGSAWACMTILKPETAKDPFPKLSAADIKAYKELIYKIPGEYPIVDFTKVADPAIRKAAEADYARICGTTGDAPPIFKPAELQAGAALLEQVADALSFQNRTVYFDRKALTAWITAKITPPEYRHLLPVAFGRVIPVKLERTSTPILQPKPQAKSSTKTLPTPQMVINPTTYDSFYGTDYRAKSIPPAFKVALRDELISGKSDGDWEALFNRGLEAYRSSDAQAIEYFAAAAELSDDPRSWTYLSLSLLKIGDTDAARRAARYSAARMLLSPGKERQVGKIFECMQDPIRETVIQWQKEIRQEPIAQGMREVRPTLCIKATQGDALGLSAQRSTADLPPMQNR